MMTHANQLVVATGNAHKVREIRQLLESLLGGRPFELLSAADFPHIPPPEETGESFEANALIKAQAYARATGRLALADDSGLVVEALDGRPGIYSARYGESDAAGIARVLEELRATPTPARGARFECVMALADAHGRWATRHGVVAGRITQAPRGPNGFGYDPIFELTEGIHAGRTTAELSAQEKNALSHRGRALEAIAPLIVRSLATGEVASGAQ